MKKSLAILSGVGLGASILLALKNRFGSKKSKASGIGSRGKRAEPRIDDLGTGQEEASQILRSIRDEAFESNDEKLAVALGRPTGEIEEWVRGVGTIDGDLLQKARALALLRGVHTA